MDSRRGGRDVGHVAFDGMGEPFKNTNSILTTLDVLCERLRSSGQEDLDVNGRNDRGY